jgi:hypothetical protein
VGWVCARRQILQANKAAMKLSSAFVGATNPLKSPEHITAASFCNTLQNEGLITYGFFATLFFNFSKDWFMM